MAEFIMKCPHCQNDLQVEDEWIGMNVDCPLCSQTFTVQKSPTKRSKNNSRTSSTPKYYCSNCKKEYPKPVKFCSECGSAIKTKSSNGAQSTQSDNLDDWTFYNWFWMIAILIGVPVLLTMWINWPRTIFWCTLPLWGVCLGMVASEFSNKLAILLFAGIIWWGWWAHTRVEIPTPEQTVKTEESKQVAKAETPAQMVKITSHSPAATSAQAKQKTDTPTPAPAATSAQAKQNTPPPTPAPAATSAQAKQNTPPPTPAPVPAATSAQAKQKVIPRNTRVINIAGHPEAKGARFSITIPAHWRDDNGYVKHRVHLSNGPDFNEKSPLLMICVFDSPNTTRSRFATRPAQLLREYRMNTNFNFVKGGYSELAGNTVLWFEDDQHDHYSIKYIIPDNERVIMIAMAVGPFTYQANVDVKAEFEHKRALFQSIISSFKWN